MIWIKRALPFIILFLGWLGYGYFEDYRAAQQARIDRQYAELTAKVWIASAKFRKNPDRFHEYRDSLLKEYDLNLEKVNKYLDIYRDNPEELGGYANLLKIYVDSLYEIEDSIRKANDTIPKPPADKPKIKLK